MTHIQNIQTRQLLIQTYNHNHNHNHESKNNTLPIDFLNTMEVLKQCDK